MLTNLKSKLQTLWNHSGFRRYLANTTWLFGGRVFQIGASFFVGVWIARYLGPAKYGLLSYAQSFVALFAAIASLGLDAIVVRELVKNESKREVLLGTSFGLKLLGSFLVYAFLSIAVQFTKNDAFTNLLIFIIASGLIFQSFNVIDLYFQSKVLSKFVVWANSLSFFLSSVAKIILIIVKAPLISFASVAILDSFMTALGYIYIYRKYETSSIRGWKFNVEVAKMLLKDSWPLVFSGVVVSIYMRIDQVMIKNMLNNTAVGEYAAAVRLSEAWYFVPTVICNSLFPAIVIAKKENCSLYYNRLQKLYNLMVLISLSIVIPITLGSNLIIKFLYGNAYRNAASVLTIHIWTGIFVFLGVAYSKWIINENYTRKNLYRTTMGAFSNIFFNVLLIKIYGIIGAAIATLISQIVANIIYDFFDNDVRVALKQKLRALILYDLILKPLRS